MVSDIYALCEAFPKSYAEQLYKETRSLLEGSVAELCKVCIHFNSDPYQYEAVNIPALSLLPLLPSLLSPYLSPPPSLPPSQQLSCLDAHSMLKAYQRHWLNYQQGAKYLDNLFSYFNRVSLKKYQPSETIDYVLPGIYVPQLTGTSENTPVEIRNVGTE